METQPSEIIIINVQSVFFFVKVSLRYGEISGWLALLKSLFRRHNKYNLMYHLMHTVLQLDPDNSNSDNLKSPLIQSNGHFPWSALQTDFYLVNSNTR